MRPRTFSVVQVSSYDALMCDTNLAARVGGHQPVNCAYNFDYMQLGPRQRTTPAGPPCWWPLKSASSLASVLHRSQAAPAPNCARANSLPSAESESPARAAAGSLSTPHPQLHDRVSAII